MNGAAFGDLAIRENAVSLGLVPPGDIYQLLSNGGHDPIEIQFSKWNNGVQTRINFTAPAGLPYTSYKWIQTVDSYTSDQTNPLFVYNGIINDHVPDAEWPFYSNDGDGQFIDTPWSQERFTAWTTLVGVDANGRLTALATYSWGYTNDFILGTSEQFEPRDTLIPQPTQDAIEKYNAQKH